MKIRKITFLAIFLLAFLLGCKKSFLDTSNPSLVFSAGYFKDSISLASALNGAYNALQKIYGSGGLSSPGNYLIGDVTTDNSYSLISTVPNWDPLNIDATDPAVRAHWINHYLAIGRANSVIKNADNVTIGAVGKAKIVAEAKFIRALAYFNMVRIWGKVPLVTVPFEKPTDAYVAGRNEVADVYTQIIADLTDAYSAGLPNYYAQNNANAGRVTKAAVITLWGEVLLTQGKYADAATKLNEIVSNEAGFNVALLSNYGDVFLTSNEMNKEIIFAVRYAAGYIPIIGSPFNNIFMPIGGDKSSPLLTNGSTAYSGNLIHADLRDAFETGDKRKSASIDSLNRIMYTKKFLAPAGTVVFDANNDWIVYRYADVLLMYAEALNGSNQSALANAQITKVRARAGLLPLTYIDQADLATKILQERRVELNMEGHRWFDLLRNNQLIPVLDAYFKKYNIRSATSKKLIDEPFRVLFPIPMTEIQTNANLGPNNTGY